MGYTISVKLVPELREKMLTFMARDFKSWSALTGEAHDYVSPLLTDDELEYCPKKGHTGFNYNASGLEREYAFSVIRWMALKAGENKRYFYDDERVPINAHEYVNGVATLWQMELCHMDQWIRERPDHWKALVDELGRLEKAWQESK